MLALFKSSVACQLVKDRWAQMDQESWQWIVSRPYLSYFENKEIPQGRGDIQRTGAVDKPLTASSTVLGKNLFLSGFPDVIRLLVHRRRITSEQGAVVRRAGPKGKEGSCYLPGEAVPRRLLWAMLMSTVTVPCAEKGTTDCAKSSSLLQPDLPRLCCRLCFWPLLLSLISRLDLLLPLLLASLRFSDVTPAYGHTSRERILRRDQLRLQAYSRSWDACEEADVIPEIRLILRRNRGLRWQCLARSMSS